MPPLLFSCWVCYRYDKPSEEEERENLSFHVKASSIFVLSLVTSFFTIGNLALFLGYQAQLGGENSS